jgi:hypothetical protein
VAKANKFIPELFLNPATKTKFQVKYSINKPVILIDEPLENGLLEEDQRLSDWQPEIDKTLNWQPEIFIYKLRLIHSQ